LTKEKERRNEKDEARRTAWPVEVATLLLAVQFNVL